MTGEEWGVTVASLVALAIVLTYLLLRRDSDIRRTRWGFFVERDRYDDEEDTVEKPPADESAWPKRSDDL